jgi:hypothetical protein
MFKSNEKIFRVFSFCHGIRVGVGYLLHTALTNWTKQQTAIGKTKNSKVGKMCFFGIPQDVPPTGCVMSSI